jgi:4-hydroxybenzoate polyprenyltransferase
MNLLTLLKISRPKFWGYLAGTFLVGYTLAIHTLQDFYTPLFFVLLGFFLFPANLFLYGINDLFDQDTDAFNKKKTVHEHRLLKKETRYLSISLFFCLLISVGIFFLLPSFLTQLLLVLFILLAAFYSASPFRFKARPFIDSGSNILYILPGVIGYLSISNQPLDWWIILAISSWAISMHLFSAIPDIEADKKAHLTTSAIFFGKTPSLLICSILWLAFSLISISQIQLFPFSLLTLVYPIIPLIVVLHKKISILEVYWYFPWINNFFGFILFVLLIWQKI